MASLIISYNNISSLIGFQQCLSEGEIIQISMKEVAHFSSDDQEINLEYIYNIGVGHAKRGKPRDAIFYFDKVLKVEPNHIRALIGKGNALGKLGKYEDAISSYDIALKIQPTNIIGLLNKGLALHYLKRYNEAINCYDTVLSQDPDHALTLYQKASSKSLQNKIEEAITLLEQAIISDSQFAEKASHDKDFEPLKNNEKFKSLVA